MHAFFTTYTSIFFKKDTNIFQQQNGLQINNKAVTLLLMNQDTNACF